MFYVNIYSFTLVTFSGYSFHAQAAFLKSPETFRADFGDDISHCILKTKKLLTETLLKVKHLLSLRRVKIRDL